MGSDTYYIDPVEGIGDGDGTSPERAAREASEAWNRPGVTLLYRRGRVVRGSFPKWAGTADRWVTIGAYGSGHKPVFTKSISLAGRDLWIRDTAADRVWRCVRPMPLCANIVYDDEAYCGAKRWRREDLARQGDWHNDGDALLVYSDGNPGDVYRAIEFVPTEHFMAFYAADHHIVVQDVHVKNAGIHGFWVNGGHHLVFRNCDVSYIGGAVFPSNFGVPEGLVVRYGNAIEVWNEGHDVLVEGCRVYENYDGGADLQGVPGTTVRNVVIRNNVFWNNGFDTFDWSWGVVVENVYFENNTCLHAGGGWAYETEGWPRLSAFLPDAVGWHVFCTDVRGQSRITIRRNIFHNASRNPIVKWRCTPEALRRVTMDFNCYYQPNPDDPLFWHDGVTYGQNQLAEYAKATGFDRHSIVADPRFVDIARGNVALAADSPCASLQDDAHADVPPYPIDLPTPVRPLPHVGAVIVDLA